jgi:antitoxin component YwqK of YwqJK toxin-antitoxin module
MKDTKIEYHPNGRIKHEIKFHFNERKSYESFYDENGKLHRINAPAVQYWNANGSKEYVAYFINGCWHNICNPTRIGYTEVRKIQGKRYSINDNDNNKLNWMNQIKNI